MTTEPVVQDHHVTLNGLRVHYLEWGSRESPPMLLLHGGLSQAHVWDEFAAAMQDRYRIIAYDQRGCGETGWAADYHKTRFVEDLAALVEHLGLARLTLIGHSVGAMWGWLYAAAHPQVVERFVINDHAPRTPPTPRLPFPFPTTWPDWEALIAWRAGLYPQRPEALLREETPHNFAQRDDGTWTWRCDPWYVGDWPPESGQDEADDWRALRAIACPTLLVLGERGALAQDQARAERIVREMRDCRLVVISGAGHNVQGDQPEAFLAAVQEFLSAAAS